MTSVSIAFGKAAADDRAALVGYLPAGFPDKQTAIMAALAMAEAGADVIEVGRELGPDALIVVNLSGRGDKDVATASKWFGL